MEVGKALSAVTAERIFESTDIYPATRTNNPGVARDLKMERMNSVKAFSNRFKSGSDTQLGEGLSTTDIILREADSLGLIQAA